MVPTSVWVILIVLAFALGALCVASIGVFWPTLGDSWRRHQYKRGYAKGQRDAVNAETAAKRELFATGRKGRVVTKEARDEDGKARVRTARMVAPRRTRRRGNLDN